MISFILSFSRRRCHYVYRAVVSAERRAIE